MHSLNIRKGQVGSSRSGLQGSIGNPRRGATGEIICRMAGRRDRRPEARERRYLGTHPAVGYRTPRADHGRITKKPQPCFLQRTDG
jgi:hypothetical protein